MLANAQSTMDVQRVISKGMMALAGLKMAQPLAEGKQKNKITAQIRRIEKLLKRSRNKIRHLNKEAELERRFPETHRSVRKPCSKGWPEQSEDRPQRWLRLLLLWHPPRLLPKFLLGRIWLRRMSRPYPWIFLFDPCAVSGNSCSWYLSSLNGR